MGSRGSLNNPEPTEHQPLLGRVVSWQLLKSHYHSILYWEVFPLKQLIFSVFIKYRANLMTTDLQGEKWSLHLLNRQLWRHSADAGSSRGAISSGSVALLGHSTVFVELSLG